MLSEFKTILKDSLTGDNLKYSSKKLSMAVCLWSALGMAFYGLFTTGFDKEVFYALLMTGMGLSGLSITDKKLNDKTEEK